MGAPNIGILADAFYMNVEEANPALAILDAGERLFLFRPEYWERDPGEPATAARAATLEIVGSYFEPSGLI